MQSGFLLSITGKREKINMNCNSSINEIVFLSAHKLRCLIIDVDQEMCHLIETMLVPVGWTTCTVNNYSAALDLAIQQEPDLIIASSGVRENGEELCQNIRFEPRLSETIIVLTTTSSDRKKHFQYFEKGCDQIVMKPFRTKDIYRAITSALKRRLQAADKVIHVLYKAGDADFVCPEKLDHLIESNEIVCFRRGDGVALLGRDPIRRKCENSYHGPERRHYQKH